MAAYPDLRPVEARRQQLHPSLPCGLEGPKHHAHLHCLSRLTRSQIGSGAARKPGLKPAVFRGFQCHEVPFIPLHHTTGPFGNYFLTKNLGKKEKKIHSLPDGDKISEEKQSTIWDRMWLGMLLFYIGWPRRTFWKGGVWTEIRVPARKQEWQKAQSPTAEWGAEWKDGGWRSSQCQTILSLMGHVKRFKFQHGVWHVVIKHIINSSYLFIHTG